MKRLAHILTATACVCGTGCFSARSSAPSSFPLLATRNLAQQPLRLLDNKAFLKTVGGHADAAWAGVCGGGKAYSASYAQGFREGYIDYIDAGGTGEPPYLPPFRYRKTRFQTDSGIEVVEDWYTGFRHGAVVARTSGLREKVLVPRPGSAEPANPVFQPTTGPGDPATPAPARRVTPQDVPQRLPVPAQVPGGPPEAPTPRIPAPAERVPPTPRMPPLSPTGPKPPGDLLPPPDGPGDAPMRSKFG